MINIAIIGYGNLGRGVEHALKNNADMNLVGIFTRRPPSEITPVFAENRIFALADLPHFKRKIDVCILCGGSKNDIPLQAPEVLKNFNCVDSFDTHADIPAYLAKMDTIGKKTAHLTIVSGGWDPGLFSLARLYFESFLPGGAQNTFWGKGFSQGHSEAVRRLNGVKYAAQYTIPKEEAISQAYAGEMPTAREKHERVCFVVTDNSANHAKIKEQIITMPNYFEPYDTTVNFIDEEEFLQNHTKKSHGGIVLHAGKTGEKDLASLKLKISLDDNPGFTGSILVSLARACCKLAHEGKRGALTVFDVPPVFLNAAPRKDLIQRLL